MTSDQASLSKTAAARMLSAALKRASDEEGLSLRQLAKILNYKQAVVLSHMSLGRVPIPIDRAEQIAEVLGLNKASFLRAVLEQRHPEVAWALLNNGDQQASRAHSLADELEAIIGAPIASLSQSQRRVLREVANDPRPERRWATIQELPALELIRDWRPAFREMGLSDEDRHGMKIWLSGKSE